MKNIGNFIPHLALGIFIIFLSYYFYKHEIAEPRNINNLKTLGQASNYYFSQNQMGDPIDLINIFYSEFKIYRSSYKKDSVIRIWKINDLFSANRSNYTIDIFEFCTMNSRFKIFKYHLEVSINYPVYFVENSFQKELSIKYGNDSLKNELISKGFYEFENKMVSKDSSDWHCNYFLELDIQRNYFRIQLPKQINNKLYNNEGDKMILWLFDKINEEFKYDLKLKQGEIQKY